MSNEDTNMPEEVKGFIESLSDEQLRKIEAWLHSYNEWQLGMFVLEVMRKRGLK